ncbi:hypothetical protein ACFLQ2_00070 [archaeon]
MVKQTGLLDHHTPIDADGLIVLHFDRHAQNILKKQGNGSGFMRVTNEINGLKEQFADSTVLTIHHRNHESEKIDDPLLVSNTRSNVSRVASGEPPSLLKLPGEQVFIMHRCVKGMDEGEAALKPFMDLDRIANEVVPFLKKKKVRSVVLAGTVLDSCVDKLAKILAKNGIDVTVHGPATIQAKEVADEERNKAKKEYGSKVTDYIGMSPQKVEAYRKLPVKIMKDRYVQGPHQTIKYKATHKR